MRISSKLFDYAIVFFALLILFVGVSINLNRFWQYELGYYDFGMFDRPIWLISQFQPPIIDHFIVGGKINLADHFNPIIYLFAPLYFISDRSELILIMPTIAIVLSGLFLYKIGKHVLKHSFLAFSIAFAFFMFLGTQNAIYSDFHEVTIASLTITLSCWAVMIKKSKKLLLLFLFLTLGLKEGLFIFGLSMGAFVYVYNHWKKFGMYVFSGSLLWGYAVVKFIIPAIAGRDYTYPITTSLNPFIIIPKLVTPIIKIKTVAVSLLNFLFLPIIALPTLPHIVLHYSSRFLTEGSTRWDLGLHYNAEIAPTLAVSSMLGILMIQKKFSSKYLSIVMGSAMIIGSMFLNIYFYKGPYILAFHPAFYAHTKNFYFLDDLLNNLPSEGSVATQNNIASRLLHRDEIYILRDDYDLHKPDYIVLDARDGQNPNHHLGIENIKVLRDVILREGLYVVYYQSGDQYIFERKSSDTILGDTSRK